MKNLCVITISLCVFFNTYAQKNYESGFIVKYNNDTVYGLIDLKSNLQNHKNCLFQDATKSAFQKLTIENIKAYRTSDKFYVVKEVTLDSVNQKVFLEYLVDGIVDLYYFKDLINEMYFIEKDGQLIALTNDEKKILVEGDGLTHNTRTYSSNTNQYKGVLAYLFQEDKNLSPKIERTNFEYKSLIRITTDYHNAVCSEYKCIDFTRSSNSRMKIEPYAGIGFSQLALETSDDHENNTQLFAGFNIRFLPLKNSSRFNFLTGLSYSANNFKGYFNNDLFYYSNTKLVYIICDFGIIRIPLTIEYAFNQAKFQPFVSLSYVNTIYVNNKSVTYKTQGDILIKDNGTLMNYQYGAALGVGFKYNFKNYNYLFLKSDFEYRTYFSKDYIFDCVKFKSLLVSVGYGLNI